MKHPLRPLALLALTVLGILCISAQQRVFVIPVETEIDAAAARQFRHGYEEAERTGADIIVLRMNTYGGALDAADSIRSALLRSPIPTMAYVDNNAASAGALIALACDSVFMVPGASMGAATVVNGSGEPLPEKYQSYMKAIMRATAEHHGRYVAGPDSGQWRRNPDIAAAMVEPDSALAFSARAAVEAGFADGIATSIPEALAQIGVDNPRIEVYEPTLTDTILGFLGSAGVRAVLIMFILGGIYMEMHTPGLGFAAAVASVATVLYFMPMFASESVPAWVVLVFILGVALIALEIFVVPGFGVTGTLGIAAVAVALIGGLMSSDGVTGFDMGALGQALITLGIGSALAIALVLWLTSSHGPRVLRRHTELMTELKDSDGFIGVDMGPARFVGHEAETLTDMRPAGKIGIGDDGSFDAVSTGEFIPAGRRVRIVKYENAQLYVCPQNK